MGLPVGSVFLLCNSQPTVWGRDHGNCTYCVCSSMANPVDFVRGASIDEHALAVPSHLLLSTVFQHVCVSAWSAPTVLSQRRTICRPASRFSVLEVNVWVPVLRA